MLHYKLFAAFFLLVFSAAFTVVGQQPASEKKEEKKASKSSAKNLTAEEVAEYVVVFYAFPGGRETLKQIRKTAIERGKVSVSNGDGGMQNATYQRWSLRGENLAAEKIRLDQDFPTAKFSLIRAEERIFGIHNNTVFSPRDDATRAFQNQIIHSIESLLRYKENESRAELAGREKMMGVEFYLLDLTDKEGRKTRYYISVKSFRVMMLDYENEGVKYRRKFYNYKYAQGTLVPYRTVLYAGDKIVEETEIGTVTYGQKVDEGLFSGS